MLIWNLIQSYLTSITCTHTQTSLTRKYQLSPVLRQQPCALQLAHVWKVSYGLSKCTSRKHVSLRIFITGEMKMTCLLNLLKEFCVVWLFNQLIWSSYITNKLKSMKLVPNYLVQQQLKYIEIMSNERMWIYSYIPIQFTNQAIYKSHKETFFGKKGQM